MRGERENTRKMTFRYFCVRWIQIGFSMRESKRFYLFFLPSTSWMIYNTIENSDKLNLVEIFLLIQFRCLAAFALANIQTLFCTRLALSVHWSSYLSCSLANLNVPHAPDALSSESFSRSLKAHWPSFTKREIEDILWFDSRFLHLWLNKEERERINWPRTVPRKKEKRWSNGNWKCTAHNILERMNLVCRRSTHARTYTAAAGLIFITPG